MISNPIKSMTQGELFRSVRSIHSAKFFFTFVFVRPRSHVIGYIEIEAYKQYVPWNWGLVTYSILWLFSFFSSLFFLLFGPCIGAPFFTITYFYFVYADTCILFMVAISRFQWTKWSKKEKLNRRREWAKLCIRIWQAPKRIHESLVLLSLEIDRKNLKFSWHIKMRSITLPDTRCKG